MEDLGDLRRNGRREADGFEVQAEGLKGCGAGCVDGDRCVRRRGVADDEDGGTEIWLHGLPLEHRGGVLGADRREVDLSVAGGGAEPSLERRGLTALLEHVPVAVLDGAQACASERGVAVLGAPEVFVAVDGEADDGGAGVGEVLAGAELEDDGADEVFGAALISGDGDDAEGFEVDEHGVAVAGADGGEPGQRRDLGLVWEG